MSRRGMGWLVLGVVLVVQAVVLFVVFDPTPHNGGDNAGYIGLAHSLVDRAAYLELWDPAEPPHTKYPPGFPLVLAVMMALGARTWVAFKLVPVAAALASVALTFALARWRVGLGLAAGVALLFGLSDAMVYASRWVLSDLPFVALTLLGLGALDRADRTGSRWFVLGAAAAIAAYFTRSAGLPLIVAVVAWLALRRMWRRLGVFVLAFGLPALVWALRTRGAATAAGGAYVSEFWLVDPYRPALGRVGPGELLARVGENLELYVTGFLPQGLLGIGGLLAGVVGIALVALALVGWAGRILKRERTGALELFFPLYAGLILLWPVVWSGDRFALPLFPLVLLYSVEGVATIFSAFASKGIGEEEEGEANAGSSTQPPTVPRPALLLLAVAAGLMLVPQTRTVLHYRRVAAACASAGLELGPYTCFGPGWSEFASAAHWSGANLPEGSTVFSRKPRIFFLLSGRPSVTFPFSPVAAEFHAVAERRGITHVLVDRLDRQSRRYVIPVVEEAPERFCEVMAWTADERGQTGMLGILRSPDPGRPAGEFGICGPDRIQRETRRWPTYSSSYVIPLLSPDS